MCRRMFSSVPRSARVSNHHHHLLLHEERDQCTRSLDDKRLIDGTGELVFGVARIFASFNDTFVHVTDLSYV